MVSAITTSEVSAAGFEALQACPQPYKRVRSLAGLFWRWSDRRRYTKGTQTVCCNNENAL